MATIVANASGGTRNWNDTATWTGGVVPTSTSDVQLKSTSGPVTINANLTCRSLDCTGYTNTLTHLSNVTLTIGDATAGLSNIALKLVSGMTYTMNSATTSAFYFASTNATQQTIAPGGKTMGNFTIDGAGSSYVLSGAMDLTSGLFSHSAGTFDTGNFTNTWGAYSNTGTTARTLTLGSSAITVSTGGGNWSVDSSTGMTVTANTATASFGSSSALLSGAGVNWNGLSWTFSSVVATMTCSNPGTFKDWTIAGPASTTGSYSIGASFTLTGSLNITGNSVANRLLFFGTTMGSPITITVGVTGAVSNVDIRDVYAAGAAGTWTGTSVGDCQGTSGITFTTPATQTHTASAGGNWSDASKWTSRVPLPQDNVVVNVNTTGTLTVDVARMGKDITFSGFAGTAVAFGSGARTIYGSLTLGGTSSGTVTPVLAGRGAQTITSGGVTFTPSININAPGGTYTLQDAFNTTKYIIVTSGTFTTNNSTVTCGIGASFSGGTTNLGSSVFNVASSWSVTGSAVVNAGTSEIVCNTATASAITFDGNGLTYYKVTYTVANSAGALTFTGNNTFDTLTVTDVTTAKTVIFPVNGTQTFNTAFVTGGTSAGTAVNIKSSQANTKTTLNKTYGANIYNYLWIYSVVVTGGAWWYSSVTGGVVASPTTGWLTGAVTIPLTYPETGAFTDTHTVLDNSVAAGTGSVAVAANNAIWGTAAGTVTVSGTINDAIVTTAVTPAAGSAGVIKVANNASCSIGVSASPIAVAAAAYDAIITTAVTPTAGSAAITGVANNAVGNVAQAAGSVSITAVTNSAVCAVGVSANQIAVSSVAYNAAATTAVIGVAGSGTITGVVSNATGDTAPAASAVGITDTANSAVCAVGVSSSQIAVASAVYDAVITTVVVSTAGSAAVTGIASDATITTAVTPAASSAGVIGVVNDAVITTMVIGSASGASITVAGLDAVVITAATGVAEAGTVTCSASDAAVITAGTASAESALIACAALDAVIVTAISTAADVVSVTGQGLNAVCAVTAIGSASATTISSVVFNATVTTFNASVFAPAEGVVVTSTIFDTPGIAVAISHAGTRIVTSVVSSAAIGVAGAANTAFVTGAAFNAVALKTALGHANVASVTGAALNATVTITATGYVPVSGAVLNALGRETVVGHASGVSLTGAAFNAAIIIAATGYVPISGAALNALGVVAVPGYASVVAITVAALDATVLVIPHTIVTPETVTVTCVAAIGAIGVSTCTGCAVSNTVAGANAAIGATTSVAVVINLVNVVTKRLDTSAGYAAVLSTAWDRGTIAIFLRAVYHVPVYEAVFYEAPVCIAVYSTHVYVAVHKAVNIVAIEQESAVSAER